MGLDRQREVALEIEKIAPPLSPAANPVGTIMPNLQYLMSERSSFERRPQEQRRRAVVDIAPVHLRRRPGNADGPRYDLERVWAPVALGHSSVGSEEDHAPRASVASPGIFIDRT